MHEISDTVFQADHCAQNVDGIGIAVNTDGDVIEKKRLFKYLRRARPREQTVLAQRNL